MLNFLYGYLGFMTIIFLKNFLGEVKVDQNQLPMGVFDWEFFKYCTSNYIPLHFMSLSRIIEKKQYI